MYATQGKKWGLAVPADILSGHREYGTAILGVRKTFEEKESFM